MDFKALVILQIDEHLFVDTIKPFGYLNRAKKPCPTQI